MADVYLDATELPSRVDEVAGWLDRGDNVFVTRCGLVAFRLTRVNGAADTTSTPGPAESRKRVLGLHLGTTTTPPDFNDPLPESFWSGGPQ